MLLPPSCLSPGVIRQWSHEYASGGAPGSNEVFDEITGTGPSNCVRAVRLNDIDLVLPLNKRYETGDDDDV